MRQKQGVSRLHCYRSIVERFCQDRADAARTSLNVLSLRCLRVMPCLAVAFPVLISQPQEHDPARPRVSKDRNSNRVEETQRKGNLIKTWKGASLRMPYALTSSRTRDAREITRKNLVARRQAPSDPHFPDFDCPDIACLMEMSAVPCYQYSALRSRCRRR